MPPILRDSSLFWTCHRTEVLCGRLARCRLDSDIRFFSIGSPHFLSVCIVWGHLGIWLCVHVIKAWEEAMTAYPLR